ncbi:MAG: hypothetical protein J6D27_07410 [Ruminiclostridium sp.]|nr:hypothetical protein [Ruminiclostridium sp.]
MYIDHRSTKQTGTFIDSKPNTKLIGTIITIVTIALIFGVMKGVFTCFYVDGWQSNFISLCIILGISVFLIFGAIFIARILCAGTKCRYEIDDKGARFSGKNREDYICYSDITSIGIVPITSFGRQAGYDAHISTKKQIYNIKFYYPKPTINAKEEDTPFGQMKARMEFIKRQEDNMYKELLKSETRSRKW